MARHKGEDVELEHVWGGRALRRQWKTGGAGIKGAFDRAEDMKRPGSVTG